MVEKLESLKNGSWIDFSSNNKPKCPHCGEDFDIAENWAYRLYDDNETHDVECPCCELEFRVNSHAEWRFSTDEQDE